MNVATDGTAGGAPRPAESAITRDRRLLMAWRAGDDASGEALLGHYHRYFIALCHRYGVRGEEERMELFQEIVVRLLRLLPRLQLRSSFGGYLRRMFHTVWREASDRRVVPGLLAEPEARPNPPPAVERGELAAAIEECAERLAPREDRVFRGRIDGAESFEALSRELDVTLNHLYVIYHGARRKLRDCLDRKGFGLV